jgi:hypothetical protein
MDLHLKHRQTSNNMQLQAFYSNGHLDKRLKGNALRHNTPMLAKAEIISKKFFEIHST